MTIDSPMSTLALVQDCSARRIRHVGDLYPLASRVFWYSVFSNFSGDGPPHEFALVDLEAVPATALEDGSTSCC